IAGAEKLAKDNKFKFEQWIVEYVFKGHQTKRAGDGGFDGHIVYNLHNTGTPITLRAIIEVKSGNINIGQIRAFKDSITKNGADFGIFVGFKKIENKNNITDGMLKESNDLGFVENKDTDLISSGRIKKMYIIRIEDLLENKLPIELQQMATNITY
ncbi:MAG: restriction endonuclease, partial [Elusimicrobiota bacterium]|nr:restriction endonuclease [Elusimicrobiota bacterium]